MTQMEYNNKTKSVEIIMNVFWDDLEVTLSKKYKKQIHIHDAEFDTFLKNYLQQVFQLKNSRSQLKAFQFIGKEIKGDTMSIYLEIPLPEGLNNSELQQAVLINDFEGQTNIVNLINGKAHKTLVFKEGEVKKKISI
ncbi:hypothetical protein D3C72_1257910 [compost metagenome]